jgi:hypothetical protein
MIHNFPIRIRIGFLFSFILFCIFTVIFAYILYPLTDKFGWRFINACDYRAGGGSTNLCGNGVFYLNLRIAAIPSIIAIIYITKTFLKKINMKDVIAGFIYGVIVMPINDAVGKFLYATILVPPLGQGTSYFEPTSTYVFLAINILVFAFLALSLKPHNIKVK